MHPMNGARDRLNERRLLQRDRLRQNIRLSSRDCNILRKCSTPGHSERCIIEAKVFMACTTEITLTAVDIRLNCDPGSDLHT